LGDVLGLHVRARGRHGGVERGVTAEAARGVGWGVGRGDEGMYSSTVEARVERTMQVFQAGHMEDAGALVRRLLLYPRF
jgi:hypothetical protein